MPPIYLDYNASTPIDAAVGRGVRPLLDGSYCNPSRLYLARRSGKAVLESARSEVAGLLDCAEDEIVFTSGGSEANNQAIKGVAYALEGKGDHIITSAVEHPAVLAPCAFLSKHGYRITVLPVDEFGR